MVKRKKTRQNDHKRRFQNPSFPPTRGPNVLGLITSENISMAVTFIVTLCFMCFERDPAWFFFNDLTSRWLSHGGWKLETHSFTLICDPLLPLQPQFCSTLRPGAILIVFAVSVVCVTVLFKDCCQYESNMTSIRV